MKKWVLSFCLSLMTMPIFSERVWASGDGLVVVEEEQIDCEELYLLEFLEDRQMHISDVFEEEFLRNLNPRDLDEEKYTDDLYILMFFDSIDEPNLVYFTPAGNPIIIGGSRCPRRITRENAILILEKCGIQESF